MTRDIIGDEGDGRIRSDTGRTDVATPSLDIPPNRSANPARDIALWRATLALLWPHKFRQYRGQYPAAASALGFDQTTVERWAYKGGPGISVTAARRIAALLRSHATRAADLAAAWAAYADDRESAYRAAPWFRVSRLTEQDAWRSKPRESGRNRHKPT